MRMYGKSSNIVTMAVAAGALGLSALCTTAQAQDSSGAYANHRDSDAEVAARVKDALHADSALDSRHIHVALEHGDVHLKGFVQDNRAVLTATQVATKAAGDHKVVNELTIQQNFTNAP